jgi:hypothetical protein
MLPGFVHENTTTTLIYHDLQDGGVTIKNAVSRWNLYLIHPGAEGWQISNIPFSSALFGLGRNV